MLARRTIKVAYNNVCVLWSLKIASCSGGILQLVARLCEESAFVKGSYFILVPSWITMDLAMELLGTYYSTCKS